MELKMYNEKVGEDGKWIVQELTMYYGLRWGILHTGNESFIVTAFIVLIGMREREIAVE